MPNATATRRNPGTVAAGKQCGGSFRSFSRWASYCCPDHWGSVLGRDRCLGIPWRPGSCRTCRKCSEKDGTTILCLQPSHKSYLGCLCCWRDESLGKGFTQTRTSTGREARCSLEGTRKAGWSKLHTSPRNRYCLGSTLLDPRMFASQIDHPIEPRWRMDVLSFLHPLLYSFTFRCATVRKQDVHAPPTHYAVPAYYQTYLRCSL